MRSGAVVRRRLLGPMAERFRRRVTVIEAGAGFGKTTLVRQAIAEAAELGLGLDVLVTVPRTGLDRSGLLGRLRDGLVRIGQITSTDDERGVLDAVWAMAPVHCCLVLDDAHWLAPDAVAAVLDLVDHLPANGHLLVASRPVSSGLARRALDAELLRLDESDLAFDDDEQVAFASARSVELDPGRLSGWPAMLELELRSGRTGALDYLVDEVLSGMPSHRLEICRSLAVFERLDDAMASALLGEKVVVAELVAGLPLVVVDDEGRVEFHELLRDALATGWDGPEVIGVLRRAGEVAVQAGRDELAIELFDRAGDVDAVRAIARRLAEDLHVGTSVDRRRETMVLLRRVLGDALEVDVAEAVGQAVESPVGAATLLERALDRAVAAGDAELEALCRLRLADHAYNAARPGPLEEQLDRLEALAAAGVAAARRTILLPNVWLRSITDRHAEVLTYLAGVRAELPVGSDPEMEQLIDFYRTINLAYTGDVRGALAAADALEQLPNGLFANRLHGFRVSQKAFLGQLTADDRRQVELLLDQIHDAGQFHLFCEGAATTALFHAGAGEAARAERLVRLAEAELHRLPATAWAHHSVAQARAVLTLLEGDEPGAARILERAIPERGIASLPRFVYGATAALSYALVPSTRITWDDDACGPDHLLRREVGRALVALRDGGDPRPARALPWDDVDRLRIWAYEPHLAELALAAAEAGSRTAEQVVDGMRLDPRRILDRLAGSGPQPIRARAAKLAAATPRRPHETLEISVLGPVELRRGGRVITDVAWSRRQRVRDLLLLLVEHRRIDRTRLTEILWPDKGPDAGAGNLRFTLSQLHGVLEPWRDPAESTWFVRAEGSDLVLTGGDRLVVDVDEFEAHVQAAQQAERSGRPGRALEDHLAAAARYRGDYLSGASDPGWAFYRSLHLRGRFVASAARAAELLLGLGELDRAEELAIRAADAEPAHEVSHRTLAEVLLARHRPGAARQVLSGILAELDEMGVGPEPATRHLARRLGLIA